MLGPNYLTVGPRLSTPRRPWVGDGVGVEKLGKRDSEALEPFELSIAFSGIPTRHGSLSCSLTDRA